MEQIPVGALFCQKDTFAREFTTQCIECTKASNKNGIYEVKLHDTSRFSRFKIGQLNDLLILFFYSFVS